MLRDFFLIACNQIPEHVVVLWPVHDRDAAVVSAGAEVGGIDDTPVEPEVEGTGFLRWARFCRGNESEVGRFECVRF